MLTTLSRSRLFGYGFPAQPATYTDLFTGTENPLASPWLQLDAQQTPMRKSGGIAFATMDGTIPGGNYDDSAAHMAGFGQNYEIRATMFKGTIDADYHEMELLFRWKTDGNLRVTDYGNTHTTGVEFNLDGKVGSYANLGTFKNIPALAETSLPRAPIDGDVFHGRVEGSRIRIWFNRASVADTPLIDVTHADIGALTGDPGIGSFFQRSGGGTTQNQLGWTDVLITAL